MAIRTFNPQNHPWLVQFEVLGEPASKANSRRLVAMGGKPRFIKSKKALSYVQAFAYQCPQLDHPLTEDLLVAMEIHYASRRPDLDESVILDAMEGKVYKNDRQVREKHVYWALDKYDPRVEIRIAAMDPDLNIFA